MIDNGISLDLICLSKPPLHSVPLFHFESRDLRSRTVDQDITISLSQTKSERSFDRAQSDVNRTDCKRPEAFDHLYTDDSVQELGSVTQVYIIPDWVDCSFWSRLNSQSFGESVKFMPRCKMYEVQMMGLMDSGTSIELPTLDIFNEVEYRSTNMTNLCEDYDDNVFKAVESKSKGKDASARYSSSPEHKKLLMSSSEDMKDVRSSRKYGSSLPRSTLAYGSLSEKWAKEPAKAPRRHQAHLGDKEESSKDTLGEYSSSIEPIRIRNRHKGSRDFEGYHSSLSNDSRESSPTSHNAVNYSPSKTPIKQHCLLRHKYVNPFRNQKVSQLGASDRRWEHIYPKWSSHEGSNLHTNWKSLCSPACLPLTIEYFPTPEELSEFYLEYTYTVSPAYEVYPRNAEQDHQKIESLLIELINQRLAQGFQLIVSPSGEAKQPAANFQSTNLFYSRQILETEVSTGTNRAFSISKPYFVCLGDHLHRLYYDASGNNVEVKRYTRRLNYNSNPLYYSCSIWSRHMKGFQTREVAFTYPALSSYNWNYLDHLISGYQDQMTDALRFWRIRFLLIPLEIAPSSISSISLGTDRLDDEEERLVGFSKFLDMIEKARFVPQEERQKDTKAGLKMSLDIQFTTLDLSSLVVSEDVHSLLPEAFLLPKAQIGRAKNSDTLTRHSPLELVAKSMMQPPPLGLHFQNRHWHFKNYENVITGEEMINWIIQKFSDAETRETAIEIGNTLIVGKILEHVKEKHRLLDGFYFYRLCPEWARTKPVVAARPDSFQHKRFQSVKQIPLDLDPQKKSSRQEIALLHYDTTHNTKNCYHFQLHWLVCTARLIEDMLHSWTRMAEKCGFKLVEAPGGQVYYR